MRINHNISALNTYNKMTVNQNAATKNMEKLSSGLRINRAGDDAAGLAISEKMRGQIRGLEQAATNAQDGISLIQTAEGALNETHAILQRQRELAVQAANGTNTDSDRAAIQEEVSQLSAEINRIAESTEFNGQSLINGEYSGKFQIGANSGQSIGIEIGAMDSAALGLTSGATVTTTVAGGTLADGKYTIEDNGGGAPANITDVNGNIVGQVTGNAEITLADGQTTITVGREFTSAGEFEIKGSELIVKFEKDASIDNVTKLGAGTYTIDNDKLLDANGTTIGDIDSGAKTLTFKDGSELNLEDAFKLSTADLDNGKSFTINGVDVSSAEGASGSITAIDEAINAVSLQRSKLGAVQNRLEHTINNLSTSSENLTSAESRIRDVDMAKEMMEMTKNNILQQAAQSMLAQANQTPQNVLQLLR